VTSLLQEIAAMECCDGLFSDSDHQYIQY